MSPEIEAALATIRRHLHDTEPDPEYRKAHEKGCFADGPGRYCAVCGATLNPETSGRTKHG